MDAFKGITILVMILGHTVGIPSPLRAFIFSYHMPAFFIANGFFIRKYDTGNTCKKAVRTLLLPYSVVCLLEVFFSVQRQEERMARWQALVSGLKSLVFGISKNGIVFSDIDSVWLVWFVCCLFVARIAYVAIRQLLNRFHQLITFIPVFLISLVGYVLGRNQYFLQWSIDVSLFALVFMWAGDELGKSCLISKKYFHLFIIPAAVFWIVLTCKGYWIEMATRSYKGGYLCVITALCGCLVFLKLSMWLDYYKNPSRFLTWAGRNSMVILAVHCLEMRFFDFSSSYTISFIPNGYIWAVRFVLRTIVILIVSELYVLIKHYIKQLNQDNVLERTLV